VQRGFLPFASPFQKELQQSFHPSILRHHSLGPSGHDNLDLIWFRIFNAISFRLTLRKTVCC
jgi:hypothetical protein